MNKVKHIITLIIVIMFCAICKAQDVEQIVIDNIDSRLDTLKFKNKRQRQQYNKLVYNVKKVLPLAQQVNALIKETYETLQMLPDEKSKDKHIQEVEKEIKRTYTPIMKKLTYSQGKLLIKLVDRECNQSSYEIVKAFLGPGRAAFYQFFAWTFRASLKKEYDPENDDRLVERVVQQVEKGLI